MRTEKSPLRMACSARSKSCRASGFAPLALLWTRREEGSEVLPRSRSLMTHSPEEWPCAPRLGRQHDQTNGGNHELDPNGRTPSNFTGRQAFGSGPFQKMATRDCTVALHKAPTIVSVLVRHDENHLSY